MSRCLKFQVKEVEELYYPCSENKGADQLRGYRKADLRLCFRGAITFALILQKFRLRLSYTCAHKSGAFALSFGVTLGPIYSQLFLGQLLVFEPCCKKTGLRGSDFFLVPVFS